MATATQAETALQLAQQQQDNEAAQLQRLAQGEPAEQLTAPYSQLTQAQAKLTAITTQLPALEQQLRSAQQAELDTRQQTEAAAQLLQQQREQGRAQETLITEQIIPLDTECSQLTQQLQDSHQQLQSQQQDVQQLNLQITETTRGLDNAVAAVAQGQAYLQQHSQDEYLASRLPLWESQLLQCQQQQTQQQIQQAQLDQQQAELTSLQSRQQQQAQQLANNTAKQQQIQAQFSQAEQHLAALQVNGDETHMQALYQRNLSNQAIGQQLPELQQRYQHLQQESQLNLQTMASQQARLTELEDAIVDKRAQFSRCKQELNDVQMLLQQEQKIASLETLRSQLQPGQPCQLCGATAHPLVADYQQLDVSATAQRVNTLTEQLQGIETAGKELNIEQVKLSTQQSNLQQANSQLLQQCDAVIQQWQQLYEQIASDPLNLPTLDLIDVSTTQLWLAQQALQQTQYHEQIAAQNQAKQQLHDVSQTRTQAEQEHIQQQHLLSLTEHDISSLQQAVNKLSESLQEQQLHSNELLARLTASVAEVGLNLPAFSDLGSWLQQCQQAQQHWTRQQQQLQTGKESQSAAQHQLNALNEQQQKCQHASSQSQLLCDQVQQQLTSKKQQRQALFADTNVSQARLTMQQQLDSAEQALQQLQLRSQTLMQQLQQIQGELQRQQLNLQQQQQEYDACALDWQQRLLDSPFANDEAYLQAVLSRDLKVQLQQLKQQLEQQITRSQTLLEQAQHNVEQLQAQPGTTQPLHVLQQQLNDSSCELAANQQRQGELKQILSDNAKRQGDLSELYQAITSSEAEYDDKAYLNSLIGSKDGSKFRRFAQGLTLDYLVILANQQLQRLHSRYQLQRKVASNSEALALQVVDTWLADAVRDTKTLSGGESFLVSLALALGLSDLVSHKTSIDSLFLDEGFGTLDAETLDIALDALDNLNASGKMIGVISHVEALKERIPVQVKVNKGSGLGVSSFTVVG